MIHTVLFDLDGTLTDSREGILNGIRHALGELGEPVPEYPVLLRFIGPPLHESFTRWCGFDREKARRAVTLFRDWYEPVGMFENTPAPGAADACRRLREHGLTLAIASSKPERMCVPICTRFGFAPYLKTITGSPDGDDWNKTQVIQEALRRLDIGADRSGVMMVGDRNYDVTGAAACGLPCLGVEFFGYAEPGELKAAGAVSVVRTVADMEAYLLEH